MLKPAKRSFEKLQDGKHREYKIQRISSGIKVGIERANKIEGPKRGVHNSFSEKKGTQAKEKIEEGYKGNSKKYGKTGSVHSQKAPALTEKKDWNKFKQEKKELKLKRKKSKDAYEITTEAKQIYEKLRCRRTEQKSHLVEKLYNLFSAGDTIKKIINAHDTARILQCMLKHATPVLREEISEKLLPYTVEMCQSKYSHFCVLRMLKYGSPNIKTKLVNSLMGNIVKLACHSISSKIIDQIYLTTANAEQKIFMCQEFYGDLYKKCKDANVKTLTDTYKDVANLKSSILGAVKSNLEHVANKNLIDNSLVHAVILQYFQACDDDKIEEIVNAYAAHIPLMLTTKEGSQAAIFCFYKSIPKNRRAIIKNIKEHLLKIATHEHGHVFLVALLNSLDDTKATKKAIYDHLHKDLEQLVSNQYGRRVIQWLIAPAETNCFHPAFINSIEAGLQYGKKDKEVRRKEIFEQIEEPIANAIVENSKFWLSNNHIGLVTADILKNLSTQYFVQCAEALATTIVQPDWTVNIDEASSAPKKTRKIEDIEEIIAEATKKRKEKKTDTQKGDNDVSSNFAGKTEVATNLQSIYGIEEAGMHIILKKIIKNDKERIQRDDIKITFGKFLLKHLTPACLKYWLTVNRGCFILLNIIEQNDEDTAKQLKQIIEEFNLKTFFSEQNSKGAQLLHKKLFD